MNSLWFTPMLASFWMPDQASTGAGDTDALFYFLMGVSAFFFFLICGLLVLFVIRYRRRPGHTAQPSPSHNTPLEIIWSAIPIAIVLVIFFLGYHAYLYSQTPPANSYDIQVQAQRWSWSFVYPNGYRDAQLHVPSDRPVRLVIGSSDVIHSLWIPAFRVKRDAVPGRLNTTWFSASQPGTFDLVCSEYCGTNHSLMSTKVVVHAPGTFDAWLAQASRNPLDELAAMKPDGPAMLAFWRQTPDKDALVARFPQLQGKDFVSKLLPMADVGQKIYREQCAVCHDAGTCPTFKGLWKRGSEQVAVPDQGPGIVTVKVDEDYLRESILIPSAKIVKGFDDRMPSFKGRLTDAQIMYLIEFIKQQD
jgi:cytochrome c oxidase subunit 2